MLGAVTVATLFAAAQGAKIIGVCVFPRPSLPTRALTAISSLIG